MTQPIDDKRIKRACELIIKHIADESFQKFEQVFSTLFELGWTQNQRVSQALLSAPAAWLRSVGVQPPEDALVDLGEAGHGVEVAYRDGSVRRIYAEDMPLLACVVEAMRLFPGSTLATEAQEIGRAKWPKT